MMTVTFGETYHTEEVKPQLKLKLMATKSKAAAAKKPVAKKKAAAKKK